MKLIFSFLFFVIAHLNHAQTIIINEISNGPSGSKEYIELLVVDTVSYNCASSTPPCIDIRNWIIDDNSGYHSIGTSGTGVAPGCNRFSNDPLWSCVPLGTIIVLYNNTDVNPSLPPDDVSLSDGNCVLIVPINHPTLIEGNNTTPGALSCSYPATGWYAGGNWSNIGMANGGDCARIVDLLGCEVHSVCWGNNDQNNVIYFSGSGTDDVWFFNDANPNLQINWTEGCTDIPVCGSDEQTPGAANNALNQGYINQFNNGCAPISPLVASAASSNATCPCGGLADASAVGSIPNYNYEWYDNTFNLIGQDSATAINLCDGTYHVIVTSSVGCEDTASVTIVNGTLGSNAGTDSTLSICSDTSLIDLFSILGGNPDSGGSWSGPSTLSNGDQGTLDPSNDSSGTYTYLVSGGSGCPDSSASINVTIEMAPDAGLSSSISFCSGDIPVALFGALLGTPEAGGIWNGPSGLDNGYFGTFDPSNDLSGNYFYIIQGTVCQNDTSVMTVNLSPSVSASIDTVLGPHCLGGVPVQFTASPTGGVWNADCFTCINGGTGVFNLDSAGIGIHQVTYQVPGACGDSDTTYIEIIGPPSVQISRDSAEVCPNDTVHVYAMGENIEWYNGSIDTSIIIPDSGDFYVIAQNQCGTDTAWINVKWIDASNCGEPEDPISWMLFPNIVTNNNDGLNDVFTIKEFQNITDLEVQIFNRWGTPMGGWKGTDGYWHGTNEQGLVVVEGTYFYIALAKDWKGEPYRKEGFFHFVRN